MVDYYFYRPLIGGESLKLALSNELICTFQKQNVPNWPHEQY